MINEQESQNIYTLCLQTIKNKPVFPALVPEQLHSARMVVTEETVVVVVVVVVCMDGCH